ncbi:hypothetical protein J27TS7_48730 [Paenibacillus dendritiformis]|nr:hypothetical protein J27TS7_48730 [Paenibacillus dendritiformis]
MITPNIIYITGTYKDGFIFGIWSTKFRNPKVAKTATNPLPIIIPSDFSGPKI